MFRLPFLEFPTLANDGYDIWARQRYLGRKQVQNTVRNTELVTGRFDAFRSNYGSVRTDVFYTVMGARALGIPKGRLVEEADRYVAFGIGPSFTGWRCRHNGFIK